MNWTMKDSVESVMRVQSVDLKNCTKQMVIEYHNKTVYECRNVTKKHCTTLWTMNSVTGEKVSEAMAIIETVFSRLQLNLDW